MTGDVFVQPFLGSLHAMSAAHWAVDFFCLFLRAVHRGDFGDPHDDCSDYYYANNAHLLMLDEQRAFFSDMREDYLDRIISRSGIDL